MPISRFDEGTLSDALLAYWSATESAIDKTGNNVNSVTSVYGNDHPVDLTNPDQPSNEITHGLVSVGAMPSFHDSTTSAVVRLRCDDISTISTPTSGLSIVIVGKKVSATSGLWLGGLASVGGASLRSGMVLKPSDPKYYQAVAMRDTTDSSTLGTVDVTKWGLFQGTTANSSIYRIDDTEYPMTHGTFSETLGRFVLFNAGATVQDNMRGYISIALLYNRMLDATERQDVFDLCDHWLANNEAPSVGPPTTVTFGPVTTNDDLSVTSWNWEASADGGTNWDEAENVLSDVSGVDTTSLVVNSATLAENGTQVRCRAISAKEPAGVESAVATLTVQAAS